MVEHNQSSYYNNGYKFNGKEQDEATGMYYYGARYYDPRISIFISVDPLAEKYPNIGGYVYVANNPINFIDPDGREIIITAGNESFTYNPNTKYSGNNSFIKKNVEALNMANTVNIGKAVIDEVVASKSVMNIVEGNTDYENTFDFDISTMTMKARESTYTGGTNDVESVMHEVFHFYQGLYGELDVSISTELEAYIFQYCLGMKLGGSSEYTNFNKEGTSLSQVYFDFSFREFDKDKLIKSFKEGVNLFKEGHSAGEIYQRFPLKEEKKPNRLLNLESKGLLKD
ncbi:RHS repeat-associated core domain-containing protein [Paenimyroides tangerinum]|uniref:RHS repeat-associated core domain-containing protein n=2 Tax=Paenimyroides tangerinum TaxID=2488728 RepID=A0A3P3WC11_9FLAO|nr:RHS repeat-associated core domain-containing protein [Paenimyroides tangerinum]